MGRIWSEAAKYQAWLRVEVAACEAYARRGRIPADVMTRIRALGVDVDRILAIQHKVKHEMVALLTSLEEQLGEDSRFVHIGLTTSDVWDTATALQLRDAIDLLLQGQERLRRALGALAVKHKDTLIVGRTHGVHAEPTTFGLKVAGWYVEAGRNLEGLPRVLRGNATAALENVALWHERDISHSSVERVVLPDSTIALDYILDLSAFIVEGLEVDPARMAENLERSYGLIYSQRVLLKLAEAGLARRKAYEIVQRNSMRAWRERRSFHELLAADPAVTEHLPPAELKACFDPSWYLRNVNAVFRRAGLA